MTLMNDEQQRLLSRLTQKTHQKTEVVAHLEAEFERRRRERTEEIDHERLRLVAQLVEIGVPKRRIGAAMGTQAWYLIADMIEKASLLSDEVDEENVDSGTVEIRSSGDERTVALTNWSDWPLNEDQGVSTGVATFAEAEPGVWLPTTDDDFSLAVERELFNEGGSARMKVAFAGTHS